MAGEGRGAAYALVTLGLLNIVAALFYYSRDFLLVRPTDPQANAQIFYTQSIGAALLGGLGLLALVIGTILLMVSAPRKDKKKAATGPVERLQ